LHALKGFHAHSRNDAPCEAALSRTARFGSKTAKGHHALKFEKAKRLPFWEPAAAHARLIRLSPFNPRFFLTRL
jgi:hypothetical protein